MPLEILVRLSNDGQARPLHDQNPCVAPVAHADEYHQSKGIVDVTRKPIPRNGRNSDGVGLLGGLQIQPCVHGRQLWNSRFVSRRSAIDASLPNVRATSSQSVCAWGNLFDAQLSRSGGRYCRPIGSRTDVRWIGN